MPGGSWLAAALIAAWTSRAAPSIFRLRSNWRIIVDPPLELLDVISLIPAILANWRSSGAASELAAVFGSAPGSEALTKIVGNSTFGSGAIGRKHAARIPPARMPAARSDVATGRRINGSEKFMLLRLRAASSPRTPRDPAPDK